MKRIIGLIIACAIAYTCAAGFIPAEQDNAIESITCHALITRLDESTDANERLVDYIYDLESENAELRETNAALIADNQALANREPEIIYQTEYIETPADDYIECGGCAAHVHDWYYIQTMDGTDTVAVCRDCYEASIAYYNGETVDQEFIEVTD